MSLHTWAIRWGVGPAALADLQTQLGLITPPLPADSPAHGKSEMYVQSDVFVEATQKGVRLFRNNSGALKNEAGVPVRFGLGNVSAAVNNIFKSSDALGWRPVVITPQMVGCRVAQFVAREFKAPFWQYTGEGREVQQKTFIDMVNAGGGDAAFATGRGTL